MGCCGNKSGCNRPTKTENIKFPSREILDAGVEFMSVLQEIASAGLRAGLVLSGVSIKNEALAQLAKQIGDLAAENAYLKTVLNLFSPMDIGVTDSTLEIHFGPNDAYTLTVPVTQRNSRREIAKQLRAAAEKLESETFATAPKFIQGQTFLPFGSPEAQ
jgi:hypothetical protein